MSIEKQANTFSDGENFRQDPITNAVNGAFWNTANVSKFSGEQISTILDTARDTLQQASDANGGLWNSTGIVMDRIAGTLEITFRGKRVAGREMRGDEAMPEEPTVGRQIFTTISHALDMLQLGTNDPEELKSKKALSRRRVPRYGFIEGRRNARRSRHPGSESDNNSR